MTVLQCRHPSTAPPRRRRRPCPKRNVSKMLEAARRVHNVAYHHPRQSVYDNIGNTKAQLVCAQVANQSVTAKFKFEHGKKLSKDFRFLCWKYDTNRAYQYAMFSTMFNCSDSAKTSYYGHSFKLHFAPSNPKPPHPTWMHFTWQVTIDCSNLNRRFTAAAVS